MRYRFFFFMAVAVALGISGCGGEGRSSDPLGTDSLAFGDSSGSTVLQLDPGGTVQLTAKVIDAGGNPVLDREVTFDIAPNTSGGTITSARVNTNAAGEARILYRAGAVAGFDVVRAFLSNGARMDVSIAVGGGVAGAQIALAAAPTSLAAGQTSILTATVTNSIGSPVKGQTVTFAFSPNGNNSGAMLTTLNGTTDISGKAVALYTAGTANPTASVEDIVQASVPGSISPVTITRTALGGAQIALTAAPTSLAAGQNSILTATVTDSAGSPVTGQTVAFAFAANSSGATLTILNGTTDVSGRAVAVYTAGTANPTVSVEDIVQAGATGSADAVVITRTAVGGAQIALAAAPTSLAAGQNSILTATVTDSTGSPLTGQTVAFAFAANSSGATLTILNGTTDVSGRAVAVYTAGATNPTASVEDTIQASVAGSFGAVVITRTAVAGGGGVTLSLTSSVTSLAAGQVAVITATVTDGASRPASGQTVTFAFAPNSNKSGATLTILSGTTDVSGRAIAQYTAGANSPTTSVQDTILASVPGSAAAIAITRTVGAAAGFQIGVTSTPASLAAGATSIIVAQVSNANGTAAAGQTVTFAFVSNASGATLSTLNGGITDAGGKALAVYKAGSSSPTQAVQDIITATVSGAVAAAIITRQASTVTGNRISSLTATPATLPTTSGTSAVRATVVGSDGVTPVPGVTVSFSLVKVGLGTIAPPAVVTNGGGQADAIFTGPGSATGDFNAIQAQILGTTGGSAVVIINW